MFDERKIFIVSGNFNDEDGKKSSGLADKIVSSITAKSGIHTMHVNGGMFSELAGIISMIESIQPWMVIWMPNIPNDKEKLVANIKDRIQKSILVTSKRNNGSYSFGELVAHSLKLRANMSIEFSGNAGDYAMMLYDPLGNVYVRTHSTEALASFIIRVAEKLSLVKRKGVKLADSNGMECLPDSDFVDFAKDSAEGFAKIMGGAVNTDRFLGNASFRCMNGFPSYKSDSGVVWVSKRNVDKRDIGANGFVPCIESSEGDIVCLNRTSKPSVDTPVQMGLYKYFRNARFMIHGHCYVNGAPFTKNHWPCGALNEIGEITSMFGMEECNFAVNLANHGFLIVADNVESMRKFTFIPRAFPESIFI